MKKLTSVYGSITDLNLQIKELWRSIMINEMKYLEETIRDLKESKKYVVPDWLEKLNDLKILEEFMKIDFSVDSTDEIIRVAENLHTSLKGQGVRVRKKDGKLVYFDGEEIYPIK